MPAVDLQKYAGIKDYGASFGRFVSRTSTLTHPPQVDKYRNKFLSGILGMRYLDEVFTYNEFSQSEYYVGGNFTSVLVTSSLDAPVVYVPQRYRDQWDYNLSQYNRDLMSATLLMPNGAGFSIPTLDRNMHRVQLNDQMDIFLNNYDLATGRVVITDTRETDLLGVDYIGVRYSRRNPRRVQRGWAFVPARDRLESTTTLTQLLRRLSAVEVLDVMWLRCATPRHVLSRMIRRDGDAPHILVMGYS